MKWPRYWNNRFNKRRRMHASQFGPDTRTRSSGLGLLCTYAIGVMQGKAGAVELFQTMQRAVEASDGMALMRGYCKEAVACFAVETCGPVMYLCAQSLWLKPDRYPVSGHILI